MKELGKRCLTRTLLVERPHSGDSKQEKKTELEEWLRVMVMEPARAILMVFHQNEAMKDREMLRKILGFLAGNM